MDEDKPAEKPASPEPAGEEKKAVKLNLSSMKFKVPKVQPKKLATILASLIVGIFIGAIILTVSAGGISEKAAGEKASGYITGNFLAAQGMSAQTADVKDEGNYYAVSVDLMQGSTKRDTATVYVSKDGKSLLVGQIYDLSAETPSPAITGAAASPPAPDAPKSDKPKVELFIMSYCPYGLQMQKGLLPVMKLLGDKIDASVKWVHYIMHGEKEALENTRQYCIQKEQAGKYWDYANCFVVAGKVDECISKAKVDKSKVEACIKATYAEFGVDEDLKSGEQFPRYKVTAEDSNKYGIQGSPGFVINGESVNSGRSPEAIKQAICNAFNTPPAECDEELDTATPSAGLGGGSGSSEGGYCG